MKKTVLLALSALTLGGCAHMGQPAAAPSAVAQQRLKQATLAIKKTRAQGALWLGTPHELALARKADAKGNYAQAIKAANIVITQCRVAQKQAADNANAKPYYP